METTETTTPQRTINLSRFFRLSFVCLISVFVAFILQYYINITKANTAKFADLKVAIFLKDASLQENVLDQIKETELFKTLEYVDSETSYKKAVELNPEIQEIFTDEKISYPAYIVAQTPKAKSKYMLNEIKNKLLGFDFVDEVVYDEDSFEQCFAKNRIIELYKKIFTIVAGAIIVLLVLKVLFLMIKKRFKELFAELFLGALASFCAYGIILIFSTLKPNPLLILDWQILYILIPFGCVAGLIAKENA